MIVVRHVLISENAQGLGSVLWSAWDLLDGRGGQKTLAFECLGMPLSFLL